MSEESLAHDEIMERQLQVDPLKRWYAQLRQQGSLDGPAQIFSVTISSLTTGETHVAHYVLSLKRFDFIKERHVQEKHRTHRADTAAEVLACQFGAALERLPPNLQTRDPELLPYYWEYWKAFIDEKRDTALADRKAELVQHFLGARHGVKTSANEKAWEGDRKRINATLNRWLWKDFPENFPEK